MSDQSISHQVTLRVLDQDGFSEFYTIRAATVSELMSNVKTFKDWLKSHGYTPDAGGPARPNGNGASANGAPGEHYCEAHPTVKLLQSKHRPGELYCPEKLSDVGGGRDGSKPVYCKYKVKL